ncbi:hypothetical protein NKI96_24430 [Mesorhizobium sp. M0292]|uniref:hypothetical protein n=1 Tax=Mesorhizobium sp. M0292 TaxID=2956929 RepID=UPI0033364418
MEEVAEAFGKIIQATDPLEALRVYEEEVSDHVGRGAFRDEISFRCEFFDEDFFVIVKNHRARLAKLKDLGIEGAYFDLIQNYEAASLKQVLDVLESDPTLKAVQVSVSYDKKTLAAPTVGVFPASAPKGEPEVTESEEGRQIFVVALPDGIHDVTSADREGFLRERMWRFRKVFLTELDRTYLGEHLVDW